MPGKACVSFLSLLALAAWGSGPARAWEKVTIEPAMDNTLYESPLDQGEQKFELSNGAGNFLFSGRTGLDAGFRLRRALLKFDLEASLPPGALIRAVELTVYQSRAAPQSPPAQMGLHRVLQAWGEGASKAIGAGGQGNYAETGDATWHHRIFPGDLWDTAGGQFVESPSAVTTIGEATGDYQWACSQGLLGDVLEWQELPNANFGWIIVGGEEAGYSAHRFNSRENELSEQRPRLSVYFDRESTLFESGFETLTPCP